MKIKQKGLVNKSDIAGLINNSDLNKKVAMLAAKTEVKAEQDRLTKLQAFDSSYFRAKSHFEDDGTQNYLVFQSMYKYFNKFGNADHISIWKFEGLSGEKYSTFYYIC